MYFDIVSRVMKYQKKKKSRLTIQIFKNNLLNFITAAMS